MRFSRLLTAAAALLMTFALCGCSGSGITERLMRAPFPAGDGKEIQEQLNKELGNALLKFPKNGDFRSAIIQMDLNNDQSNEAIVFYRRDEASMISIAVLEQKNESWRLVATKESDGGEVERVMFGDVDGDGDKEIIVGWTIYSSGSNVISAYDFKDNIIQPISVKEYSEVLSENISVAYTDMQIADFDGDGNDEIIASFINLYDCTASAKYIDYHSGVDNSGTMTVLSTAPLDGHVVNYVSSRTALLTDSRINGVVLDGFKDNSTYVTEFIFWDSKTGAVCTPFYDSEQQAVLCTSRNISALARDIDSDGIIDIPITDYLPGYENSSQEEGCDSIIYLTTWYGFDLTDDGSILNSKKRTVINPYGSYMITWLSEWDNKVTCRVDERNSLLYFYRYRKNQFAFSDELCRIKTFTADEWKEDHSGYVLIQQNSDVIYGVSISAGQELIDIETIKTGFLTMQ